MGSCCSASRKHIDVNDNNRPYDCAVDIYYREKVKKDAESQTEAIKDVKTKASELTPKLSSQDRALVSDRLSALDKKQANIIVNAEKRENAYNILGNNLIEIHKDVENLEDWMRDQDGGVDGAELFGHLVADVQPSVSDTQVLIDQLSTKSNSIKDIQKKYEQIKPDLTRQEQSLAEDWLHDITSHQHDTLSKATQKKERLETYVSLRAAFQQWVDAISDWLGQKEQQVQQFAVPQLKSADVKQQQDLCKVLVTEIQKYKANIDKSSSHVKGLEGSCNSQGYENISAIITEIEDRYAKLLTGSKHHQELLKQHLTDVTLLETNVTKAEAQLSDVEQRVDEMKDVGESIDQLRDQQNKLQELNKSCLQCEKFITTIKDQGDKVDSVLSDDDTTFLQHQLTSLHDRHSRLTQKIEQQLQCLEVALDTKSQIRVKIEEAKQWLTTTQNEIRSLNQPLPHNVDGVQLIREQYQTYQDKLQEYNTQISELTSHVESLQSEGQQLEADEIGHLTSQHTLLMDQVTQQTSRCDQAIGLREQFAQQKTKLEEVISDCQARIEDIKKPGVPNDDKIKAYKEVLAKINGADPILIVLCEKGYQVSAEGSPTDCEIVSAQLEVIQHEVEHLKATIESECCECERIRKERANMEIMTLKTIDWLEQRCDMIGTHGALSMDVARVDIAHQKHKNLEDEVLSTLSETYNRTKLQEMYLKDAQEPIPEDLTDHLTNLKELQARIQNAADDKTNYLNNARIHRVQFDQSLKQVTAWLQGAEELLASGQGGLDYGKLQAALREHKDYFTEASLCQDELEHLNEITEHLNPSMDVNDQSTLKQSLQNTALKVTEAITSAQNRHDSMEKALDEWNQFQELESKLSEFLTESENKWSGLDSRIIRNQADMEQQTADIQEFVNMLDNRKTDLEHLNDLGHSLTKMSNDSGKKSITEKVDELNQRWTNLSDQAQNKLSELMELDNKYKVFMESLATVQQTLKKSDTQLDAKNILSLPSHQLIEALGHTKETSDKLQSCANQMELMRKDADELLHKIPGAEATVHIQESLMGALELHIGLSERAKEHAESLQEEIDSRDKLKGGIQQTTTYLQQINKQLTNPPASAKSLSLEDRLNKYKEIAKDVDLRIKQIDQHIETLLDKYVADDTPLPSDIQTQLHNLKALEESIKQNLKDSQEQLEQKHGEREQMRKLVEELNGGIVRCSQEIKGKPELGDEAVQKHKELGSEVQSLREQMKVLTPLVDSVVSNTKEKGEKKRIRRTFNELEEKLRNIEMRYKKSTENLNKATELSEKLSTTLTPLSDWTDKAMLDIQKPLDTSNFATMQLDIEQCNVLLKDLDTQQANLKSTNKDVNELERLCTAADEKTKIDESGKKLRDIEAKVKDRLHTLEKAKSEQSAYEKEFSLACDLIDEANVLLRSDVSDVLLDDQVQTQKDLILRLENQKEKVDTILRKHPELRTSPSLLSLNISTDKLPSDLTDTNSNLRLHLTQTEQALENYQDQDAEIQRLTDAITVAEEQLSSTGPLKTATIEQLKREMEHHKDLTSRVASYEGQIHDVNTKDSELSKGNFERHSVHRNNSSPSLTSLSPLSGALSARNLSKMNTTFPDTDSGMHTSRSYSSLTSSKDLPKYASSAAGDATRHYGIDVPDFSSNFSGKRSDDDSALDDSAMLEKQHLNDSSSDERDKSFIESITTQSFSPHDSLYSDSLASIKDDFKPLLTSQPKLDKKPPISPPSVERAFDNQPLLIRSVKRHSLSPAASFESISSEKMSSGNSRVPVEGARWNPLLTPSMVAASSEPNIHLKLASRNPVLRSSSRNLVDQQAKLAELNKSWNNLQKRMGDKEAKLKSALQIQENFQKSMNDVDDRLSDTEKLLKDMKPNMKNVEDLAANHKDILVNISTINEDIAKLKHHGSMILAGSDPPSHEMKSKLTILEVRAAELMELARNKETLIKEAIQNRERHLIELQAYKKRVAEQLTWLHEARLDMGASIESYDSTDELKQQQHNFKELQYALSQHLQQVSDLAIQCDNLCVNEPPKDAQTHRDELLQLQTGLGDLKMELLSRQRQLKVAMRESERRENEMIEYNESVAKLQEWIEETRKLTTLPTQDDDGAVVSAQSQRDDLRKGLEEGLSEHRNLIATLPEISHVHADTNDETDSGLRQLDLQQKWERLSNELSRKRLITEDAIARNLESDLQPLPYHTTTIHLPVTTKTDLHDVRHLLDELSLCWQGLQSQVANKQTELDEVLKSQHKLQDSLSAMSLWLDSAEMKLVMPSIDSSAEDRLGETESLLQEIRSLQDEISNMSQVSQQMLSSISVESRVLITKSLTDLAGRVQTLETQARQREMEFADRDAQLKEFQHEVKLLDMGLQEILAECDQSDDDLSVSQSLDKFLNLEYQLKVYDKKLHRLQAQALELSSVDPRLSLTLDMATLHNRFVALQNVVHEKRDDLQKFYAVQDKYAKMLEDYTQFLETSQGKLKPETVAATDLHHLKQQLNSHKDFFSDLDEHKSMLDSLERQCDRKTTEKLAVQQSHAHNMTTVVQDKASLHSQKLERLIRQWTDLEMKLSKMTRILTDGENQLPKPVSDSDSLEAVREKLAVYKRISRALGDEKSSVQEIIEKGKELLKSVSSPELEKTIGEFGDKWLELNNTVNSELKKAETLAEQWHTFDTDAAMLESWLINAKVQLSGIKHLSDHDTKNIPNIRAKVDRVVEFRKEVEAQTPLKNAVFTSGQQLIRFKKADSPRIERRLKEFSNDWDELLGDIMKTEEYLHQAQMDLMPSRQAMNELTIWIDEVEKMLKEDKYTSAGNSAELELLLKKYKGYQIDLASKQLTVDFINQTAVQLGHEPGDLSSGATDFAEKLGQLNRRWQSVKTELNEKQKTLDNTHSKWQDYERTVKGLQTWLRDQEDRVKRFHLIGNETNVKTTLRECKSLQAALATKERDIESCRREGMDLVDVTKDSPRCIQGVRDTAERMKQQWSTLDQQLSQLQGVLEDVLTQWNNYHLEQQTLGHIISETEYCLGKYSSMGMDANALQVQQSKLKNLQNDFDNNSGKLEQFATLSNQLMHVCDAPIKHDLLATLSDMKSKWKKLSTQLASRITKLDQTSKDWQRYNEEHDKVSAWLEGKEKLHSELLVMRETPGDRQQCLDQSKTLQLDLDNFQSQLVALGRLGDDMVEGFDSPLTGIISSRQKILSQRLATLRHMLTKHIQTLQDDLTDYKKFQDSYDAINNFLDTAEHNLSQKDPDKMADELTIKRRLDEFSELSHQFTRRQQDLDSLNDMGYRMALSEMYSEKLLALNHRWHGHQSDTAERYRSMQSLMLMQQDFHQKRENWMSFLNQAERDLTSDIAGNYKDLCEQQRKCEQFQVEVYNKQQVLQSILSDGQRMLRSGDIADREEFQRKLTALSDQWQNVISKADRFKSVIDDAIVLWQTYFALWDRLNNWLANREYDLKAYEFDKTTLQKIKYLLEKSRSSLNDFTDQESNYKKIHTVCRELLQQTDPDAERDLRKKLSSLQQRWYQAFGTFDGHRERLEDIMNQWQQCEEDIEDVLNWLREIRGTLCADLPAGFEALQNDLHKCKDIEACFGNSEDKRHVLHARQTQLATLVETDDLVVLNERIRLLDKQWEELLSQVAQRRQLINDRLHSWQHFTQMYEDLCVWIEHTEAKISSNTDGTIEDLLIFIEQDYQQMIDTKEGDMHRLVDEGHRLMRASSEARANDINHKLATLQEKWHHLILLFNDRRSKLQETLQTIKQLEMSMADLRTWLANQEYELGCPLSYRDCESAEIKDKLDHHQNLHRDIERHSAGVTSVLNLCEVLLHDSEACPGPKDYSALERANHSLNKRWKNICVQATDRRSLIEDTWKRWEKLISDCQSFSKWVTMIEGELRTPLVDHSNVALIKEEIRYFEALEHKVHDHISDLEDLNKQYRLLAREGRTDNSNTLKSLIQQANDQWDALLKSINSCLLRLKQNTGLQDDFERKRRELLKWMQMTIDYVVDVEGRVDMGVSEKVVEVKKQKSLFDKRMNEMDDLGKMAVLLIEQCELSESTRIQGSIDEFHRKKRETMDALKMAAMKLNKQASIDEVRGKKRETMDALKMATKKLNKQGKSKKKSKASKEISVPKMDEVDTGARLDLPGPPPEKHRATAHVTPITKRTPEKKGKKGSKMEGRVEELAQALEDAAEKLLEVETQLRCVTPTGPDTEFAPQEYIRLLVECEESIDRVKECEKHLKSASSTVPLGGITSQVKSLMNRWEILNARALEKDARLSEHRDDWAKFQSDINTMEIWLSDAEAYKDNDRYDRTEYGYRDTSSQRLRDFDAQMEDMQSLLMSLNITSKGFIYNHSTECQVTRERLRDINRRWEHIYANSLYREETLPSPMPVVGDSAAFHYAIHDSLRWLESVEAKLQRLEPVTTLVDVAAIRSTYRQLVVLNDDMLNHEPEVTTLRETADELLLSDPSPEMSQARDKTRIICNRLRSLKRRCQAYIAHLQNRLDTGYPTHHPSCLRDKTHIICNRLRSLKQRCQAYIAHLQKRLDTGYPSSSLGASGYSRYTTPTMDTATVLRSPLTWPRKPEYYSS